VTRRLTACAVLFALRVFAQPACTIRGTVTDEADNRAIVRARVIAESESHASYLRLTDDRGRFCFERINPARYQVVVQKSGYLEELHGVSLTVEEGSEVKPVQIRMTAFASIAGVVVDADGGLQPNADINLWRRVRDKKGWQPESVESASADRQGAFGFSRLAPGQYYLSVRRSDSNWRRTNFHFADSKGLEPREMQVEAFYSASFTFAGATAVMAKAGEQVEGLILTIRQTPPRRIAGRIGNVPKSGYLTFTEAAESPWSSMGTISYGADGSFTRDGIPPGRYTLTLRDGSRRVSRKDVDVTNGDAVGIVLDPLETFDIPIVFRTEGKAPPFHPLAPGWGTLVDEALEEGIPGRIEDDGSYRFVDVPRGVYRLVLKLNGQILYVKKLAAGGKEFPHAALDLREGSPGSIEITLSPNFAEVQGRAVMSRGDDSDSDDPITVVLADGLSLIQQAGTDQKGRFKLTDVAPGSYRMFAIVGFDEDQWGSPELAKALTGKSVEVEVKESEKKDVTLPVISSDEWEAAVKKSGG
jgi:hypothetical protein